MKKGIDMDKTELIRWYELIKMIDYMKLDKYDYMELLRLNYQVIELAHKIHNDNMLEKD